MTAELNGGKAVIRTGTFQFVGHKKVQEFLRRGWMVTDNLGGHHGRWSVLMWRCDCPIPNSSGGSE